MLGHRLSVCSCHSFLVCGVRAGEMREREKKRERESFLPHLLIKTLILLDQGLTLMTSFNLNYFCEPPSPNTATLGVRDSAKESGGDEGMMGNKHPVYNMQFPS